LSIGYLEVHGEEGEEKQRKLTGILQQFESTSFVFLRLKIILKFSSRRISDSNK
jgi:hypothetical protein